MVRIFNEVAVLPKMMSVLYTYYARAQILPEKFLDVILIYTCEEV
jgi:hypothetical protein